MITIAVQNNMEHTKDAVKYIEHIGQLKGLKIAHVTPLETVVYYKNKKIPLRTYLDHIDQALQPDFLIVELKKEALEHMSLKKIAFSSALFFESKARGKRYISNKIKARFYIVPENYHKKDDSHITYGWSRDATVSASSVELQADGKLNVQCCLNPFYPLIGENEDALREFGVEFPFSNVEALLATIATFMLYGVQIS